jgi:hypothetical protein
MGLSETIIAASIGAAATMVAGVFQFLTSPRPSKSSDTRSKRGNPIRSIAVVLALMVAAAASGFLYAEIRNERTAQDLDSLREELNAKLQKLAAATERLAERREQGPLPPTESSGSQSRAMGQSIEPGSVESVLYAPACDAGVDCTEANSRPVALCGAIPITMQARKFDLFIKSANHRDAIKADFEQDVGGAKFTGPPNEFADGGDRKNVCVNFWHWSVEPHIAMLVLHYGAPVDIGPGVASQPATAVSHAAPAGTHPTVSLTVVRP